MLAVKLKMDHEEKKISDGPFNFDRVVVVWFWKIYPARILLLQKKNIHAQPKGEQKKKVLPFVPMLCYVRTLTKLLGSFA